MTPCASWLYFTPRQHLWHGPLTRYVKLRIAHAPGMPGTFSPTADFKGNCWLATPACITARASRTCRDACRDRLPAVAGKTFPAFPAHAHQHFYVSGKRPILTCLSSKALWYFTWRSSKSFISRLSALRVDNAICESSTLYVSIKHES